ncbi:hypothetical protein C8R47DRAFT_1084962 [Mycena vitilis]|nr:hypothetical protein C8R47DRAFT_1084962 [Mycena vitilis]
MWCLTRCLSLGSLQLVRWLAWKNGLISSLVPNWVDMSEGEMVPQVGGHTRNGHGGGPWQLLLIELQENVGDRRGGTVREVISELDKFNGDQNVEEVRDLTVRRASGLHETVAASSLKRGVFSQFCYALGFQAKFADRRVLCPILKTGESINLSATRSLRTYPVSIPHIIRPGRCRDGKVAGNQSHKGKIPLALVPFGTFKDNPGHKAVPKRSLFAMIRVQHTLNRFQDGLEQRVDTRAGKRTISRCLLLDRTTIPLSQSLMMPVVTGTKRKSGGVASSHASKQQKRTIETFFSPQVLAQARGGNDGEDRRAVPLNREQTAILRQILDGENLFFTGSAGTGKSLLLRAVIRALKKKFQTADAVAVTASTGMAATNIGGGAISPHFFAGY